MSDALDALLARAEKKRRQWVTLEGERAVQIVRPTEVQMALLPSKPRDEQLAFYCGLVVDWRGFTEADLGGPADMVLTFSARAWGAIWPDQVGWVAAISEAAVTSFETHAAAKGEAAKN